MPRSTLRVYVLGSASDLGKEAQLTVLADFKDSHAAERIEVAPARVDALATAIRQLEAFLINGHPRFAEDRLRQLGGELFALIFRGKVRSILQRAMPAAHEGELRPLQLVVEDQTIASWPWEYAYDPEEEKFLCRSFYPLCRGVFSIAPRDEPPMRGGAVRILFLFGASRTDPDTNLDEQMSRVRHAFTRFGADTTHNVNLVVKSAIEPADLQAHLQESSYDILHFYGHAGFDAGRDEGYLTFDKADAVGAGGDSTNASVSSKRRLYATQLADIVSRKSIQLAFLNACETATFAPGLNPTSSSIAATLVSEGIPAVIATQFVMPDNSAHYFAAGVYKTLAQGRSVTEAMREGRTATLFGETTRPPDWGIPVLYASYPELTIFKTIRTAESEAREVMRMSTRDALRGTH